MQLQPYMYIISYSKYESYSHVCYFSLLLREIICFVYISKYVGVLTLDNDNVYNLMQCTCVKKNLYNKEYNCQLYMYLYNVRYSWTTNTCFGVLKTVLSGGSSLSVGIKEKAESSHGLPFMVKEFVPVSIFNSCGSAILIDYISFNMAEFILPLSGARSTKRMVNIWSNRSHILIDYRWYEFFISNDGTNFKKTPSKFDDLLYYPQFSAVNIIFPIWKMKVRRVFLFDVSKPKSWKCVGFRIFFPLILNYWNSILFV